MEKHRTTQQVANKVRSASRITRKHWRGILSPWYLAAPVTLWLAGKIVRKHWGKYV